MKISQMIGLILILYNSQNNQGILIKEDWDFSG